MKNIFILFVASALMVSCGNDKGESAVVSYNEGEPVEGVALAETSEMVGLDRQPVDGAVEFETPLPQGVIFTFPYNARLDMVSGGGEGGRGRRVEFEIFSGDGLIAMADVSIAMERVGFKPGPVRNEDGVVRQAFAKDDYGTVNARAQLGDVNKNHGAAIGYVVMAWPKDN